jgi:hypothetical protein
LGTADGVDIIGSLDGDDDDDDEEGLHFCVKYNLMLYYRFHVTLQ